MATDTLYAGVAGAGAVPPELPDPGRRSAVARAARMAVVAVALVPIGVYLYVALHQIGYRYELEWMEGGVVEIVQRVVHGQPIYTAPSLHYVPYTYTPLYFWLSAAMAKVVGVGFLALRLVSLLASLGCFALLFRLVWRETRDPVAGAVAAGVFAATFEVGGAWLDIGRVDSLFLLLTLAAVSAARRATTTWGGILVGLLVTASFLTKQTGLLIAAPVLLWLVVRHRRAGLVAVGTVLATVVGSTLVLSSMTHGWYQYYVLGELAHQGISHMGVNRFFPDDLLRPTGWAIGLGVIGMAVGWRRRSSAADWPFWVAVVLGMVGTAWISRVHSGGGRDVLIPAYAAIALLAGLGYDALRRAGGRRPALVGLALAALVVLQVTWLSDHPAHLIPRALDAQGGAKFVALVHSLPGDVIVFDHPWYETLAGKPSWADGEAVDDVLRAGPSAARTDLRASIRQTLDSPSVSTVLLDDPFEKGTLGAPLAAHFVPGGRVFACYQCFFPPVDLAVRPYIELVRQPGRGRP